MNADVKMIALVIGLAAGVFVAFEIYTKANPAPVPNTGQGTGVIQGATSLGNAVGGVLNDLGGMVSSIWNPAFLTNPSMQGNGNGPVNENTPGGGN
jgi:predicted MFS family arabinose efflux permease